MSEHHFWYDLRQRKTIGLEAFHKKTNSNDTSGGTRWYLAVLSLKRNILYLSSKRVPGVLLLLLFVCLFVCLLLLLLQAIFTNKIILITYIAYMLRIKHDLFLWKKDNRDMKRVSLHPIMIDYQSPYGSIAQTLSNILRINDKRLFCLFVFLVLSHRCAIVIINQIKVKVNWNN